MPEWLPLREEIWSEYSELFLNSSTQFAKFYIDIEYSTATNRYIGLSHQNANPSWCVKFLIQRVQPIAVNPNVDHTLSPSLLCFFIGMFTCKSQLICSLLCLHQVSDNLNHLAKKLPLHHIILSALALLYSIFHLTQSPNWFCLHTSLVSWWNISEANCFSITFS